MARYETDGFDEELQHEARGLDDRNPFRDLLGVACLLAVFAIFVLVMAPELQAVLRPA
jgi:hypothetical protein